MELHGSGRQVRRRRHRFGASSAAQYETAVVKQLEKAYAKAGIRPGAGTFTFGKDDDAFTATLSSTTFGNLRIRRFDHVVTLHFAKGKLNLGSVPGHAYISGL